ncbi:N-6 DNA methylase [bacterium]|nr:N-6 DNA methylase [bacterium]
MSSPITEWEFTADVASWINQYLALNPSLVFKEAKCEQRASGSAKRRDISLIGKDNRVLITGEVKLPYMLDGATPYNETVYQDARKKAVAAQADYFFTWNVNECALWETFSQRIAPHERQYKAWQVLKTPVDNPIHLEHPMTTDALKHWLPIFLNDLHRVIKGEAKIGAKSPDENFIFYLEAHLKAPIHLTLQALIAHYQKPRFKSRLDQWMRDEQGWIISDEPEAVRDNLERAAKFACYALVNKLVFHEAMLKRYGQRIKKITVPKHIDTGEDLRLHLEKFFAEAKEVTGDYETVFGEDHTNIGALIPFYSDHVGGPWRELIEQIHNFDFSKLEYDIIGRIFERLIAPEERHKYGQYYTSPEVVDLINSFCITRGDEKVLDPACGGGTFLVRAYARKRTLAPGRQHGGLLKDLFGADVSKFATHLTTINLATRDLIDEENYPQIARTDFFNVRPRTTFLSLPSHAVTEGKMKSKGMGAIQHRDVEIPKLDAVVGNPPYVRQEDIAKDNKEKYAELVKDEWKGINLSGRSDLHVYFWPHATTFLKEDGYFCFLTSSQWLDVEYGFRLQEWILQNFEIVAIIESVDEPWFVGARVVTAITILRRQAKAEKRIENTVRFVQLRMPIKEILANDGTTTDEMAVASEFRDELLKLEKDTINSRYRARLIKQADLYNEGLKLGTIMGTPGRYYGGKWGVHLRAPDVWFSLMEKAGMSFSPLGEIAQIWRGITTGKDSFFFPKDISDELLQKYPAALEFEEALGVPRKKVADGTVRMVECGEGRGEIKPLEAEYLEPEVHSLMEISRFTVSPEDCSRKILLVDKKKSQLKGTYVLEYIKWGEKQGFHKGATCAARVTAERDWYDLTGHKKGLIFLAKSQQYKHIAPVNNLNLQCNCNLYDVHLEDKSKMNVMAGILNSSIAILSKFQFGRPVGVEGNLKTEVVDVNMMLIPDPKKAKAAHVKRVADAFNKMKKREALYFLSERRLKEMVYRKQGKEDELHSLSDLSELEMPDRHELDDAVLEMMGISSKTERKAWLDKIYSYLREHFELTRQKEEKAIENKKTAASRGAVRPADLARQLFDEIREREPRWLRKYDPDFMDAENFWTLDLPENGKPQVHADLLIPHGVSFAQGKKKQIVPVKIKEQAPLACFLAEHGTRGLIRVPVEAAECSRVFQSYSDFIRARNARLKEIIEERTADEDMQEKVYTLLAAMF